MNENIPGWSKIDSLHGDTFGVTDMHVFSGENSLYIENDPGEHVQLRSNLIPVESGQAYTAIAKSYIELLTTDMYVSLLFDISSPDVVALQDSTLTGLQQGVVQITVNVTLAGVSVQSNTLTLHVMEESVEISTLLERVTS